MNEILTVKELLDQLREPENKRSNPFVELLPKAQELLGLGSKLDTISLEALLIQAIIYCVFDDEDEPDKISKEDAKKRDSYLLAMGLLEGYYHIKSNGMHYTASLRHKDYLANSQYKEIYYGKDVSSGKLSTEEAHARAKTALSTADRRCREELADYLVEINNCRKCFEKGSQKYIKEVKLSDGKTDKQLILPEPRYILEIPPATERKSSGSTSVEDNPSKDDALARENVECENELGEEIAEPIQKQESEPDITESTSAASLREQKSEFNNTHDKPSLVTRREQEMDGEHDDNPNKQNPPEPPVPEPDNPSDIQLKLSKTAGWLKTAIVAFVISILVFMIIVFGYKINKQWTISRTLEDLKVEQEANNIEFTNSEE